MRVSSRLAVIATALFIPIASASCFEDAGAMYGVSPLLLRGMAQVESSMRPGAMNKSHATRTGSYDIGLMQINSRWLQREPLRTLGYEERHLLDACTSVKVGAWILSQNLARYQGDTWEAVGAYNAACTSLKGEACRNARSAYAWKVYRAMEKVRM